MRHVWWWLTHAKRRPTYVPLLLSQSRMTRGHVSAPNHRDVAPNTKHTRVIMICSSYMALFLAEASSKRFTIIITPGRPVISITCWTPWGVYTLLHILIALSVYCQIITYGWVNQGTAVVSHSRCGTVFDKGQVAYVEFEPSMLWLGVQSINHSVIGIPQCKNS